MIFLIVNIRGKKVLFKIHNIKQAMWQTLQINVHLSATTFEINRHLNHEIDPKLKNYSSEIFVNKYRENKNRSTILFCATETATPFFPSIPTQREQTLKCSQPQSNLRAVKYSFRWRPFSLRSHWIYHN